MTRALEKVVRDALDGLAPMGQANSQVNELIVRKAVESTVRMAAREVLKGVDPLLTATDYKHLRQASRRVRLLLKEDT